MSTLNFQVPPAIELRRKTAEARRQLQQRRSFQAGEPECPAGTFVAGTLAGAGCRCGVEETTISEGENPSSLAAFCFGEYRDCPTWRAEKQRIAEGRRTPLTQVSLAKPGRPGLREVVPGEGIYAIDGRREGRDG